MRTHPRFREYYSILYPLELYIFSLICYNIYHISSHLRRFMQNHTNNPFKRNVPFWAFDIQSVYFPGPQTAHHFVMKFEHAHQFYEMNISYSHIPVRHTVSGKYTDTTTPFFSFRAPLVLHSVRTLTNAPYTRSIVYFHPRILKKYENVCSLGRLSHVRACTIPLDEKQLERLDRLIIPMSKFWAKDAPENICVSLLAALLYEICDVIPRDLPTEADARPYMQEMMLYIVVQKPFLFLIFCIFYCIFCSKPNIFPRVPSYQIFIFILISVNFFPYVIKIFF